MVWRYIATAITIVAAAPAEAQESITDAQAATVVRSVREQLATRYVFPDLRSRLAASLDAAQRSGRYRTRDVRELANRVTADMRAVIDDRHLRLVWDSERFRIMTALRVAAAADSQSREALWADEARSAAHGIAELRLMEGNVRYIRVTDFWWIAGQTDKILDDAMRYLAQGDAIIFDLRGSGGGDPATIRYIMSHFLPPNTPLMLHGATPAPDELTIGDMPAGSLAGKPLFVLTDQACGSACEELVYHVKHFDLGEIVGARTEGAANNNDLVAIAPGFVLSISVHSPRHSRTGTNWEAVGIEPDLPLEPRQALLRAHVEALTALQRTDRPHRARTDWALVAAAARLSPYTPSASEMTGIAGTYGDITISLRAGRLVYQRAGRPEQEMQPLTLQLYAIGSSGAARLRLLGQPTSEIEILYSDGTSVRYSRG